MKRKLYQELLDWKEAKDHKPLLIFGARQVGKSYLVRQFGAAEFEHILSFNFEEEEKLCSFFDGDLSPESIIQYLELTRNITIQSGKTLLFFDEIQACPRALNSLKYFAEQMPNLHLIAAGSLLGVALKRGGHSFPVGKVKSLQLYPMDFEEFLWAKQLAPLAQVIREHSAKQEQLAEPLHLHCLELYQEYSIIGGMPEVITKYLASKSYLTAQSQQHEILQNYLADTTKYATASTGVKIRACFNSIPAQLAKNNTKFQYKVVKKGGSASYFEESLDWLCSAGISLQCLNVKQATLPLKAHVELSNFKLYMSDIGLLTQHSGIPLQSILAPLGQDIGYMGAMAENYIAQALHSQDIPLYYWHSEGKAEVDFVLQDEDKIIPIEVKHGTDVRSRSMNLFLEKHKSPYGIRFSQRNFGNNNQIIALPLYAAFAISETLAAKEKPQK